MLKLYFALSYLIPQSNRNSYKIQYDSKQLESIGFQLISDIHLEYYSEIDLDIIKSILTLGSAPNLIIAGDFGNPQLPTYKLFLDIITKYYERIFIISGNHEYYSGIIDNNNKQWSMERIDQEIENIVNSYGNCFYLNNKEYEIKINSIVQNNEIKIDEKDSEPIYTNNIQNSKSSSFSSTGSGLDSGPVTVTGIKNNNINNSNGRNKDNSSNVNIVDNNDNHKNNDKSIIILGTTLWSRIPESCMNAVQLGLNDYNYCYKTNKGDRLTVNDTTQLFEMNLEWLKQKLIQYKDTNKYSVIIITHHLPSFNLFKLYKLGKFINKLPNIINAFGTDLEKLIIENPNIKYWCCGHSHESYILPIGNSYCLLNPRGYHNKGKAENLRYDKSFTFSI